MVLPPLDRDWHVLATSTRSNTGAAARPTDGVRPVKIGDVDEEILWPSILWTTGTVTEVGGTLRLNPPGASRMAVNYARHSSVSDRFGVAIACDRSNSPARLMRSSL
jgi:hypothetical protein